MQSQKYWVFTLLKVIIDSDFVVECEYKLQVSQCNMDTGKE